MQYFAGKDIFSGVGYHGWTAGFWPPLFSILIGLGSFVLPGFLAGKFISILASSILLFVTYHLAVELSHRNEIGLWSQVFLGLSPVYFYESLQAHNHMIDALFFTTGLTLFIKSTKSMRRSAFLVSGIVCGLAGLSRFTSYILIFLPLFLYFWIPDFKKIIPHAVEFWIGFAVISLPWWFYNTINNGSPISTWEYLNICTAVVPGNSYGTFSSLWSCRNQSNISSLFSLILAYPIGYIKNFAGNMIASEKMLREYGGALTLLVIPAFLDSIFHVNMKKWVIVFGELLLLVGLVSQDSILDWYLLGSIGIVAIMCVMFLFNYAEKIGELYPAVKKYRIFNYTLVLLTIVSLAMVFKQITDYKIERNEGFADLGQITQLLIGHDPNIKSKVIMATDPAWSYYTGAKYLSTPAIYDGTLEGLVSYQGVSDNLKYYAPKYPSTMPISDLRADYFIYRNKSDELPQYSFLFNPGSDKIPGNFKLIYKSPNTVVYEITWK